jgi:hypothetical protein
MNPNIKQKSLSLMERKSLIKKGMGHLRKKKILEETSEIQLEQEQGSDSTSEDIPITDYVEILQKQYADITHQIRDSEDEEYVKIPLIEAEQIWLNVKILLKTEQYSKMDDAEKIKLIETDFKDFYKNFPIVSRYMICLGQYSMHAFKRMIIRCKTITETTYISKDKGKSVLIESESESEAKKNLNEKLWVERQADYVQFLWEDFQEKTNCADFDENAKKIWTQTYESLTNEFNSFKELHESAEQKIKDNNLKYKKELLYEMSDRIISGKQKLDDDTTKQFINKLKDKLFKQKYNNVVKQLATIPEIKSIAEDIGNNEEEKTSYDSELQQNFYKKTFKKVDITKFLN